MYRSSALILRRCSRQNTIDPVYDLDVTDIEDKDEDEHVWIFESRYINKTPLSNCYQLISKKKSFYSNKIRNYFPKIQNQKIIDLLFDLFSSVQNKLIFAPKNFIFAEKAVKIEKGK
ncbi:hypothetical protein BpHYR1_011847 [Brachionus plicatilis]|uniref:Uncharacterized protein n=1 Tax=Brachionus plicatilis TaxID=10195 RepID=A0A3M7RDJ6_BRAPC|nr:hypothetical protein BpHYR1_011847 [Brachionus plicatilis]